REFSWESGGGFSPVGEIAGDGLANFGHGDTGGLEFGRVHYAIGARGFGGGLHELTFVFEKREILRADAALTNKIDDFTRGDLPGVSDVVNAEWHALFPAGERRGDELMEL